MPGKAGAGDWDADCVVFIIIECLFRCPYGSDQGFPLDGTKLRLDGPGPSRALDPLFDVAVLSAPNA